MDLPVQEFIDGFFKEETVDLPSDVERPDMETMSLPPWYAKDKFDRGRRVFWNNSFAIGSSFFFGVIALYAIPSVLNVLKSTKRSNSSYTAYKRYVATTKLVLSWVEHELKPGSLSWKTLHLVRKRHFKSNFATKKKGVGIVSQRDMSLTLLTLTGLPIMDPSRLGMRALYAGDWEAYNHTWATIGYMLGIEDRYNIFRKNLDETREVFKIIRDRVLTPCLENVPEYFEHMSRMLIDGMSWVFPVSDLSCIFYAKYLANVPGYMLTEDERIQFKNQLKVALKGKPIDAGVDSTALISQCAIKGLPKNPPPRYLYVKDYDTLTDVPAYKRLDFYTKFKVNLNYFLFFLANYHIGRLILNMIFKVVVLQIKYFPLLAGIRFGLRDAYVNMMEESPMDDTVPLPNSAYYKKSLYV